MKPNENVIPREIKEQGLKNLLFGFSNVLDKAVDFGSNVLSWDVESSTGGDEQVPIIMSFRHLLELIDSISILVRSSSIDPCKLLLRGALETYFGLDYIFKDHSIDRCMAFIVCNAHKNLKSYKKLDIRNEQGKQTQSILDKEKSFEGFPIPDIPDLKSAIANIESLLSRPEYIKAETEYQNLINAGVKNPSWYQLFNGPNSVKELADYLEHPALYEFLFRNWSGPTHGTDIYHGKIGKSNDDKGEVVQIRFPKDAQSVTACALTISIKAYSTYIENRIPDKEDEYREWYKSIKIPFLKITSEEKLLKIK